jgi:para-nitrobenzyl esterase
MSFRIACVCAVFVSTVAAHAAATLRIEGGVVAEANPGTDGIRVYRGLPYAAPPIGERRWQPPMPVIGWKGVRPVNAFASNCLQPELYTDLDPFVPSMSEDCLYLNIWTGAGGKRPVLVWFHGGGYQAGAGSEPRYDGTVLAEKGLVVVTVNYRLGVFGFLAHPELTAESAHHASGDYALMDMIAALHWVRRNIALFGGDPNLVTIAGESAGSDAVSRLMASPLASGLFERAIGESGAAFGMIGPDKTLAEGEAQGTAFAHAMGADTIAALRRKSSAEILAEEVSQTHGWAFDPVVDGFVLPAPAPEIFAAGRQNDVPMLVGWNADEGRSFQYGVFKDTTLSEELRQRFGAKLDAAEAFYPSATPEEEAQSRETYAGDKVIAAPTWAWAAAESKTGHAPVYLYLFAHPAPIPLDWYPPPLAGKDLGAFHSSEIVYAFGHPQIYTSWHLTQIDRDVADLMSSYWAAFARTGNPNGAARPDWPTYDPNGTALRMVFDAQSGAKPDSELKRHEFFEDNSSPKP